MTHSVPFTQELVQRGDKKQLAQVARCAAPGCHEQLQVFNASGFRVLPPAGFHQALRNRHWSIKGKEAFCPTHSVVERVIKPSKPKPLIPVPQITIPKEQVVPVEAQPIKSLAELGDVTARQMTPEHRRKINKAIFDNWDDGAGRYIGKMTDKLLATALSVPPAWVEQVRIDNFGDSGGNEEIEQLKLDLDNAIAAWSAQAAEATRLVDAAMNGVTAMDRHVSDLKELRKRLERVEVATLRRS